MKEFIEILNSTSPERLLFYALVLLGFTFLVMGGAVEIIKAINSHKKK